METLLGRDNAWIDALYFLPHHLDTGFAGAAGRRSRRMVVSFLRPPPSSQPRACRHNHDAGTISDHPLRRKKLFYSRHPGTTLSVAITGSTLRLNSMKS
jgi:hypothetical protein